MVQLSEHIPPVDNLTNVQPRPDNIQSSKYSSRLEKNALPIASLNENHSNINHNMNDSTSITNEIDTYDRFINRTSSSRNPRFPTIHHGASIPGIVKRKRLDRDILIECIDSDPLDFSIVTPAALSEKNTATELVNDTTSTFESKKYLLGFKGYFSASKQSQSSNSSNSTSSSSTSSNNSEISGSLDDSLGSLKTTRIHNTKAHTSSSFSSTENLEYEYRDDDNDNDHSIYHVNIENKIPIRYNDDVEDLIEREDLDDSEHDDSSEQGMATLNTRRPSDYINIKKLLEQRKALANRNQIKPDLSSSSSNSLHYQSSEQDEFKSDHTHESRCQAWSPFPCQEIPEDSFDEEYRNIQGRQIESTNEVRRWTLFTCLSFQNNSSSDMEDEEREKQQGLIQKFFQEIREIAKDPFMTKPIHDDFISLKETNTATFSLHDDGLQQSMSTSSGASFLKSTECANLMEATVTSTSSTIPETIHSFCTKDTEKAPSDTQVEVSNHGSVEFLQVNEKIISILTSPSIINAELSPCCSSEDSIMRSNKLEKIDYVPLHRVTKHFKRKEQIKNTWAKVGKNARCLWIKSALFFGKNPYLPQQRGWSEDYMEEMFGKFSSSTEKVASINNSEFEAVDDTRQDFQCD